MGVRAVTPVGKTALSATSGRPQPRVLSGCVWLVAKRRKAASSAIGVRPGCSCFTSAADAARIGVANDVPLSRRTVPPPFTTQTATPGAVRSGLRRPSAVGPRDENPAMLPSESSAPAVMMESASPGVTSVRNPEPLLPAAVTRRMPRRANCSAATLVTATSPLSCEGV